MKQIISIAIVFLFTFSTLYAQEWHTDFQEAKTLSTKEHKPIILVFQGSDWCAPCIKLDREIWSTDTFKNYAKDHFVMLKADFPKRKKNALPKAQQAHNDQLAETYNQQGYFPYVVVLDGKGNVQGSLGYKDTTPEKFIELLESF